MVLTTNVVGKLMHMVFSTKASYTGSYDYLIVRLVAIRRTCDRSAMFATVSRSGRILRSVFFAGGRPSYDWSYAWSRDQQRSYD